MNYPRVRLLRHRCRQQRHLLRTGDHQLPRGFGAARNHRGRGRDADDRRRVRPLDRLDDWRRGRDHRDPRGWPLWACILLAFAIACMVGYVNGQIVVKTGLPSFIVTLAGLFILRGLTIGFTRWITGRTQVSGLKALAEHDWLAPVFSGEVGHGLMVWLASLGVIATRADGSPAIAGLPVSIIWWFALTAVATWLLLRTRVGNWIFACGGDANAARNVGVPVTAVKVGLFMFTACAATLFACVQVLDAGSADTNRGLLKEFEAIIASVIGGCLLTGGYGSAIGASFGALIFGTVQMGIFYTGVNTDWFKVFLGVMMLIAVVFNNFIRRKVTEAR
ncbi:MAG TPA: ABC transporter permease [Geminicoccaceae bacterium]|nr:ABC transporter permease [Geminicoccaceae bacterium]